MRKTLTTLLLLSSLALAALSPSCAQKSKKKAADRVLPEEVSVIYLEGFNRDPVWIDKDQILFHSSLRERHSGYQLYHFKLGEPEAKRVTFHDGDTDSAVYVASEKALYYSSSTDEVKELSDLVARYQNENSAAPNILAPGLTLYPTEIYRSNLEGGKIQRLTRSKGFDGRLQFNPETQRLLYSSLRKGVLQLFSLSGSGKNLRQLTSSKTHSLELQYSQDLGRYLWIELSEEDASSVLRTADKRFRDQKTIQLPRGRYISARFATGQDILISAEVEGFSRGYDLFLYRMDSGCLVSLLNAEGDQLTPALSPDQTRIAFVHQHESTSHIALMDFKAPLGPCLAPAE